jgi:hypothetical protein
MAVLVLRKRLTAAGDGGAALVEAVGVMRSGASALCSPSERVKIRYVCMVGVYIIPSYPLRHYDTGNGQRRSYEMLVQAAMLRIYCPAFTDLSPSTRARRHTRFYVSS